MEFNNLLEYYKTHKTNSIARMYPEFMQFIINKTPFLDNKVSCTQRLWHIYNDIYNVPLCNHCNNNIVNWDNKHQCYRQYCSIKCGSKAASIQHTKKIQPIAPTCKVCNNLVKMNSTTKTWNSCCSERCKHIDANTKQISKEEALHIANNLPSDYNYRKFTMEYRAAFNTIRELTKHLPISYQIKKRISWLNGEIKTKQEINSTIVASLGFEEGTSVRYAKNTNNLKHKQCLVCSNDRVYNKETSRYSKFCSDECKQKYKKLIKIKQLIKTLTKIVKTKDPTHLKPNYIHSTKLDDVNWLYHKHYVEKWTKQRLANYFNVDKETITNRFKKHGILSIRHPSSGMEKEIVDFIIQHYNGEVITNSRSIISPSELDIYLPELNLAIEFCGLYWHSDIHNRIDRNYHKRKLDKCNTLGIRLITIYEDEWLKQSNIVKNKLLSIIGHDPRDRIFARSCNIINNIDTKTKINFFNTYHIQGNGPGSINIGLTHNNKLLACISFIQKKDGVFVLNRYATRETIIGGFSKLLKHFKQTYKWKKIITFADLRWSEGQLYDKCGFILDKKLPPDYQYINGLSRIHKFNYRHSQLSKKLDNYDPNISETQNTKNNNILRIWDCGKLRYVMENMRE